MKIVIIGGTGLIGSKLVRKLGERGHKTVAAAPNTVSTLSPARDFTRPCPAPRW